MPAIKHHAPITAPAEKIYHLLNTITGLEKWLRTEDGWKITGDEQPGGILTFHYKENGFHQMKVVKLKPHETVNWECTSGHPEWLNTTVNFAIEANDDKCMLSFGHEGWAEKTGFYSECHDAWGKYVAEIK
ncbi:MAG: hypothetical protein EOO88_48915, partial [Pedobacter sp.]